jgi:hypothetical protein
MLISGGNSLSAEITCWFVFQSLTLSRASLSRKYDEQNKNVLGKIEYIRTCIQIKCSLCSFIIYG